MQKSLFGPKHVKLVNKYIILCFVQKISDKIFLDKSCNCDNHYQRKPKRKNFTSYYLLILINYLQPYCSETQVEENLFLAKIISYKLDKKMSKVITR